MKFLTFTLLIVKPVTWFTIAHPRAFHVLCRDGLDEFRTLRRPEVPHRVDILVLAQVLGHVISITSEYVHHTPRKI
jgi:hypothetical protein